MAGYLEKRGKDSYRLTVAGGTGSDGKRIKHRKTVKATSKKKAEIELAKFVAEVEKGQYIEPSRLTLAEFSQRWLRDYVNVSLSPKTAFIYKEKLEDRILPAIGHLKLEQIKPMHLLDFYANLKGNGIRKDNKPGGLSADTIQQYHRVISSILQHAVDWQIIPENPASRAKPPKIPKRKLTCFDENQTAQMLEALNNEPLKYRVLTSLAALTGLRRGELLGLEWSFIDFEKRTMEIRNFWQKY